ncbi:MAG: FAD-binding oxidoreductase [Proteobacteria bacterium]|nr:FAD-binding oxidoreductase [Pseudomonadota bacterium]
MVTLPKNDRSCGWIKILPWRDENYSLSRFIRAKWVIVGAGYSGLSAAITLAENNPNDEIILLEANKAGEGASSRNSGFLLDSTLNDGHLSDNGLSAYKSKYDLNKKSLDVVRDLVKKHQIDCSWNECGKYHVAADLNNEQKLKNFNKILDELNIENQFIDTDELETRLGTAYYKKAVKTKGSVLLQPAALARGMIKALPRNVSLFENTPVLKINHGNPHIILTRNGKVVAENLIIAVNGFMPGLGYKKNRVFPLLLTASLSRPLSRKEQAKMKNIDEWGVLSANPMGATLRYTNDHRLLIRNTVEVSSSLNMDRSKLSIRQKYHLESLRKRFPFLPDDILRYTWSGITCISSNNANIFEQRADNLWMVGCYNGGGIGLATLFGQQIAYKAMDQKNDTIKHIFQRPKPNWLPPQPFLNWGIRLKLAKDRTNAKIEN